jgi:hypothetical protein
MAHNNNVKQPWLGRDALDMPSQLHSLPKHPKQLLPKYDPEVASFLKDHIKKCILSIRLMSVQHEDVVCKLFPYTFENTTST